ncbi:hypothetical protein EYF80_041903 [Liparis tanakae]|uniref:Uncharacterized protein n=1 Tax=Liparis tanakae TaxID=230148 RepID=A0A4Z2G5N2_9TELE|nr:hypothetical protein EYF80_041903 [Liparis tanakae]
MSEEEEGVISFIFLVVGGNFISGNLAASRAIQQLGRRLAAANPTAAAARHTGPLTNVGVSGPAEADSDALR